MVGTTTNKMRTLNIEFKAQSFNEATGDFWGYASTWELDKQKERFAPGAFTKTLAAALTKSQARGGFGIYPVLWSHDPYNPIGIILEAHEDAKGLAVHGQLDLDIEYGRRAFSAIRMGFMRSMSVGFYTKRDHVLTPYTRVIDEADLVECSITAFPANDGAIISTVKSDDARLRDLVNDMALVASRYGAQQKGRNGMANEKIGRLYINRDYGTKTAAEALHVPEAALKEWLAQEERRDGLVKSPRGNTFVYPAWELAQIVQAHGYDVNLIDTAVKASEPVELVYGREEESRAVFERALRRELREEDDLYLLHGRAYDREVARRQQEHQAKWQAMDAALKAERADQAARRIEPLETYTLQQLATKSGIDLVWLTRFVQTCIAGGEVSPAVEGTLVLRGCDYGKLAKKHHQEFEMQFMRAANKLAEQLAQEKRVA